MCGRFLLNNNDKLERLIEDLKKSYSELELSSLKFGEIFPSFVVPVVTKQGPKLMKWGYNNKEFSGLIINARNETINIKPAFKKDIINNRCLIPINGFFEWFQDKYLVKLKDHDLFFLAGCYKVTKEGYNEFVVLTKQANGQMLNIHQREPVIFTIISGESWLSGEFDLTNESHDFVVEKLSDS